MKKGVDHKGKAKDIVKINWVVIVKLKGSNPVRFHARIANNVKRKGVVSLLKGFKAEQSTFIIHLIKLFDLLLNEKYLIKKGNKNGKINSIQFNCQKLDVPGSNIFNICAIIRYINLFLGLV